MRRISRVRVWFYRKKKRALGLERNREEFRRKKNEKIF